MSDEEPRAVFRAKPRPPPPPSEEALRGALAALEDTWVPSRYNLTVDLPDGRKAVYNTRVGALAVLDAGTWRRCLRAGLEHCAGREPVPEVLRALYRKGFLVPAGVDEIDLVRQTFAASRFAGDVLAVNLAPTLACNLRCPYCFEGKAQETSARAHVSRETEAAIVRRLAGLARARKEVRIVWFGGEPLLVMDSIERMTAALVPALEKEGVGYHASTVTNGLLLDPGIADRLVGCRSAPVQVTVDVPGSTKRDRAGRETRGRVLDNLAGAAGKLKVHLRVNVVGDDEAEFDALYDGLVRRGLHETLAYAGTARVTAPECGRPGCAAGAMKSADFSAVARREQRKARALGLPVFLRPPMAAGGPCSATCVSTATIGPDGLVYKCVEDLGLPERAHGSVFLEGRVRYGRLLPWLTYDWFGHDACRGCIVLPQCAGGCPHDRMYQSDALEDDDFCNWLVRDDLEERVREMALSDTAKSKGPHVAFEA